MLTTVVDLQFGSTGKGNIAVHLAHYQKCTAAVTAWMPNAGHTAYYLGTKFVHSMLASSAVIPYMERIYIGPGSAIDIVKLQREYMNVVEFREQHGMAPIHLFIHEHAAICSPRDAAAEKHLGLSNIGSTQKGSMAAVDRKRLRDETQISVARQSTLVPMTDERSAGDNVLPMMPAHIPYAQVISHREYIERLALETEVIVEGSQGYSLGLDHGFWPYVTSRNCTVTSTWDACAIPLDMTHHRVNVGVARTYPIRVANQTGSSGPGYPDQEETSWEALGLEPELTTVTQLPRRVFTFSHMQIEEALAMSDINHMALTFVDYPHGEEILTECQEKGYPVNIRAYGPDSIGDVISPLSTEVMV